MSDNAKRDAADDKARLKRYSTSSFPDMHYGPVCNDKELSRLCQEALDYWIDRAVKAESRAEELEAENTALKEQIRDLKAPQDFHNLNKLRG